jgi:phosphomannomutase/phosphoglucomutase
MNPSIFREYDIRGVVGKDFDEEFAYNLGRAFARKIVEHGGKKVACGRDCRVSSPALGSALVSGMKDSGLEVINIGIVTTPMLYFSLFHLNTDGGIMASGSHNPPDQNGFKVCIGKETIWGEEILKLKGVIDAKDYPKGKGSATDYDLKTPYIDYIVKNIKLERPLKVIVDAGNGTAGPVAPIVLKKLGCQVTELYCDMDGRFPNHHPDPTVEKNVAEIRRRVVVDKADVGIAYDGDADRIGVIDDKGGILWGDILMILLSRALLKVVPGATIIGEVKCSHRLFDDIEAHGGKPLMWKAGHSLIKAKMKEVGAQLGGEMSGHIFYKNRWFGFDDAIYTSARVLEILAQNKKPLSDLLADVPPAFTTPELRIKSSDEKKFEIVEKVKEHFAKLGYKINDVDGMRLMFEDGWGLVRASNTQPMLVMRFEANTEPRLEEIRKLVEDQVNLLNKI